MRRWMAVWTIVTLVLYGSVGCKRSSDAPAAAPPPPPVTVAHPIERQVMEWDVYSGWLDAVESVEVMARISGFIEQASFQEGALVNQGDLLFVIDVRPYQAELDRAEAEVARAQAQQAFAQNEFRRLEVLRPTDAVSELELENARQSMLAAEASVASAKAQAESARLNVEFCRVTAPISGRIGRKLVTPGNLISGGASAQPTLLTTIESIDPIYCYTEVDERSVLKYQALSRDKKRVSARDSQIVCYVGLSNETGFPHKGYIDFVDNRIDPQTGTLEGRGVLNNPTGFLTPGLFARIRIPGSGTYTTLLVPDSAVGTDQNRKFLLLVGDDNAVELRTVELGHLFGGLRAIIGGITREDRIIINGLQRARPGTKVAAQDAQIEDTLDNSPSDLPTTAPATQPAATQAVRP